MKKYKLTPLGKFVISIVIVVAAFIAIGSFNNFTGFGKKTLAIVGMNNTSKVGIGIKSEAQKEPKAVIVKKLTSTSTPKPTPKITPRAVEIPKGTITPIPTPTMIPQPLMVFDNEFIKSITFEAVAVNSRKGSSEKSGHNSTNKSEQIVNNVNNRSKNVNNDTEKRDISKKDSVKNKETVETEDHAIFALKDVLRFVPNNIEKKELKKSNVEIFYIPHPDDELLSMGVAIADSVKKGKEVHLVLYTHGYESNALKIINGDVYCKWHKKVHNPRLEGYSKLTEKDFGKYRVKEFVSSAICLGVKEQNIHIMNFYEDSVTPYEVKLVMLGFEKQFPEALHNASSYQDKHPFHKKIGNALLELYKSKEVKAARFFISPVQWSSLDGETISNEHIADKIEKAIGIYQFWEPKDEHYGIGYHSYQNPFDNISNKIISKYHNPSN